MSKASEEHRQRVNEVILYIKQHMDQDLSVRALSDVSSYSPFHFHRIFVQVTGETPSEYVKRVRLERAAHLLIYEQQLSVTAVSLACGFSSLSYFTTSFSKRYGMSPKSWREGGYLHKFPVEYANSKISKTSSKKEQEKNENARYTVFRHLDLDHVRIDTFQELQLFSLNHFGEYSNEVQKSWDDLFKWVDSRDLYENTTQFIGIPRHNPLLTDAKKCLYECGVTMMASSDVPKQFHLNVLPKGKYVLYELPSPVTFDDRDYLIQCYTELYSMWLPKSGYHYNGDPIEFVQFKFVEGTLEREYLIHTIGLPLKPLE